MKERLLNSSAHILGGSYDPEFTRRIASELGQEPGEVALTRFANSEIKAEVPTVRGDHVFVIQSHGAPVDQQIMEQLAIINAAKRAGARIVTAVMPYRGYSRADKPDNSHESFMGPLTMRFFAEAGADRIIEVDPHAGQSAGFLSNFNTDYIAVPSLPAVQDYIKTEIAHNDIADACIVAPDAGRAKLNERYADNLLLPLAIIHKRRIGANVVSKAIDVVGDVAGKHCFMIDDMVDTAGTIVNGAEKLRDLGASNVTILATHGIFSGPAIERLSLAKASGIIGDIAVTDTLRRPEDTPEGLVSTISVAPLVATAIRNVFYDQSVSNGYRA